MAAASSNRLVVGHRAELAVPAHEIGPGCTDAVSLFSSQAALGHAQPWSWVFENVADHATPPRDVPAEMRPTTP